MKKFQFSLDKILELRRYEEQEWENKLAAASSACDRIRLKINEAREKSRFEQGEHTSSDVYSFRTHALYLNRLQFQISQWQVELKEKEAIREKIRVDYLKANRKRLVLSKLKEKRKQEHHKEFLKKEIRDMDDMSSARIGFVRRKQSEGP